MPKNDASKDMRAALRNANDGSTFEELMEALMAEQVTPRSEQAHEGQQLNLFDPAGTEERKEGK